MKRSPFDIALAPLLLTAWAGVVVAPVNAGAHSRIPVLIQVTRNTQGEVWSPAIRSQEGDSIVFVSDGDVEGPGTAAGHREVYIYRTSSGDLTRITNTTDGESYDARPTASTRSGQWSCH